MGYHINALGLAIGKDVHLILHCKNPKEFLTLGFISMPTEARQRRGSTHENAASVNSLRRRTNDVHMRFPVIWKG